MPDWSSPVEIQKDAGIFIKFMHALFGLYVWEWFVSLDFDWEFISGKKKFRWPMIFYFGNRYLLFFAMIGIIIALDTTSEINCQALFSFNQITGDAAIGLASINLSIRTMAVWSQNKYITALLVLIILGHWSLILQVVLLKAHWVPGTGCVITHINNTTLAATFIYSMAFDFVVLLLNAYKLVGISRVKVMRSAAAKDGSDESARAVARSSVGSSRLGRMIFADGLIFFIIAFLSNLLATVFMLLSLNSIMSIIFNVPAAVGSTIVACRAVRRLSNFSSNGPEVFVSTTSGIQFRPGPNSRGLNTMSATKIENAQVHVQMETFTHAEDAPDHNTDYLHYDAAIKRGLPHPHTPSPQNGSDTDVELEADVKATAGRH